MDQTTNLKLPYIIAAQSQKHVTHNEALKALDALVQLAVLDRDLAAPPASPTDGARYIVAASPTGAWAGQATKIAAYQDGAWQFYVPLEGWTAWVADEDILVAWDGSAWIAAGGGGGGGGVNPVAMVGINATADSTNRLSLASPASLFNHEGAGHQLKINKSAAGNTASVLYQTGFSGRAEFGTAGDDDFHVKVSPDGSAWHEAIVVDKSNGAVRAKCGQVDVASAATCDIGAAAAQRVRITGTTTITSLGTAANELRFVMFSGALTLTHNATILILPGAANITTAAGDTAVFASDSSGNWSCLAYQNATYAAERTRKGFGTAATVNTGTDSGAIPVLTTGGLLPQSTTSYLKATPTIADDGVAIIDMGFAVLNGMALVLSTGRPTGIIHTRATSSPSLTVVTVTGTYGIYSTALAGTTGTDGRVNFGVDSTGKFYIENRTGISINYSVFWYFGN